MTVRRRDTRPQGPREAVFWVALGFAALLTAALVWLLATPEWQDAAAGAVNRPLLGALRVWTAVAWGLVIVAGVRLLRRG